MSLQIFSLEECADIVAILDTKKDWEKWVFYQENNTLFSSYNTTPIIIDWVSDKFKTYIEKEFSFSITDISILALKYNVGDRFGRHFDRNPNFEHNKDFLYNVNVVLNDNFEGGEFWLDDKPFLNNSTGIGYSYSSTQWHEVKTITKGIRYSMLCYIRERDLILKRSSTFI
jgi:hypothetical protein